MTPKGRLYRDLRESRGKEQRQLAKEMGIPAAHLSAMEHGTRTMSAEKEAVFARVLGLSRGEVEQLAAAHRDSLLRFQISPRLSPLHIRLANRLIQRLDKLTPEQVQRIESTLERAEGIRPSRQITR